MERIYKTLIRKSGDDILKHLRNNTFVRGKISGILCGVCGNDNYPVDRVKNGYIYTVKCEDEKYVAARKLIDTIYPNVCEFDVD